MESVIVSGRVDAATKKKAARYIKRAGQTPADVIRIVWENIATTGEVPAVAVGEENQKVDYLKELDKLREELRGSGDALATMTDAQMRDMLADRYA